MNKEMYEEVSNLVFETLFEEMLDLEKVRIEFEFTYKNKEVLEFTKGE